MDVCTRADAIAFTVIDWTLDVLGALFLGVFDALLVAGKVDERVVVDVLLLENGRCEVIYQSSGVFNDKQRLLFGSVFHICQERAGATDALATLGAALVVEAELLAGAGVSYRDFLEAVKTLDVGVTYDARLVVISVGSHGVHGCAPLLLLITEVGLACHFTISLFAVIVVTSCSLVLV